MWGNGARLADSARHGPASTQVVVYGVVAGELCAASAQASVDQRLGLGSRFRPVPGSISAHARDGNAGRLAIPGPPP